MSTAETKRQYNRIDGLEYVVSFVSIRKLKKTGIEVPVLTIVHEDTRHELWLHGVTPADALKAGIDRGARFKMDLMVATEPDVYTTDKGEDIETYACYPCSEISEFKPVWNAKRAFAAVLPAAA